MKNLRMKYWYYILILMALFYAMTSFSQYQYNIKLDVNDKMSLTTITSEISDVSNRYINDDGLLFSSNNLYDSLYFTKYGYNIEYFKVKYNYYILNQNYEKNCCVLTGSTTSSEKRRLDFFINGTPTTVQTTASSENFTIPYCDGDELYIAYSGSNTNLIINSDAGTLVSGDPWNQNGVIYYSNNACSDVTDMTTPNDCEGAINICSNESFPGYPLGTGTQELNSSNRGCLNSNENQSQWYYIYIQDGGELTFTISPSNLSTDYDFAVWGPFTELTASDNCPPVTQPIRCNYSRTTGDTGLNTSESNTSQGAGGTPWIRYLDTQPVKYI